MNYTPAIFKSTEVLSVIILYRNLQTSCHTAFSCMRVRIQNKWRCKRVFYNSSTVGGHAVTVQVLSTSRSSQNPHKKSFISLRPANPCTRVRKFFYKLQEVRKAQNCACVYVLLRISQIIRECTCLVHQL